MAKSALALATGIGCAIQPEPGPGGGAFRIFLSMNSLNSRIATQIAQELGVRPQQVEATVGLLDEGSTVPFIARYRKEATGGLDDTQLRTLEERLRYLRELEERRAKIGRAHV